MTLLSSSGRDATQVWLREMAVLHLRSCAEEVTLKQMFLHMYKLSSDDELVLGTIHGLLLDGSVVEKIMNDRRVLVIVR